MIDCFHQLAKYFALLTAIRITHSSDTRHGPRSTSRITSASSLRATLSSLVARSLSLTLRLRLRFSSSSSSLWPVDCSSSLAQLVEFSSYSSL